MTPEQQRIAIAEACGWYLNGTKCRGRFPAYSHPEKDCHYTVHQLPNYPGDLNAMHEVEKALTDVQFGRYHDMLLNETPSPRFISASAAQRAEAFLRTIGKWTDS